jgi:hypothetical protein
MSIHCILPALEAASIETVIRSGGGGCDSVDILTGYIYNVHIIQFEIRGRDEKRCCRT